MILKQLNNSSIDLISKDDFSSFKDIVILDIKSESSDEIVQYLHDHLDLWSYVLQILRKDIELQLSCQNAKVKMHKNNMNLKDFNFTKEETLDYINKQHNWRMTAVKFLSNIERKTLYVKMLIKNK
jgi:hypothetical protein